MPGGKGLTTAVTEVFLEPGARLEHTHVIEGNDESYHLGHIAVRQKRDSSYTNRSIVIGGKLNRVEIDCAMREPGAECTLDGMYHAIGHEHVDHTTHIIHAASACSSNEEYRGLVDDRAHAVFDGTIEIKRDAQQSSAHQKNHNLLLSDTAVVNTKPHLEIDADDVSASHGATVGAIDADQLFFLRARGIDEDRARAMLTFSFVRSIVDRISSKAIRDRLVRRILARMPAGDEIEELAR
jgi:Fe-S cluster assembly protein SufD